MGSEDRHGGDGTIDQPGKPASIADRQDQLALPPAVELLVGLPAPLALLVGQVDASTVSIALDRANCNRRRIAVQDLLGAATSVGPFDLAYVGPDAAANDDGIELVRQLCALSPAADVVLLCPALDLSAAAVIEALRAGIKDVIDPHDTIAITAGIDRSLGRAATQANRVLAIGAHPDDVEIGCGGTLLEHRRRGDAISILTLSHGSVGGDRHARTLESVAAAESAGARLLLADLPDTSLDPGIDTIRLIEGVVRLVDPTIVYVHSASDHHQDHRAVHSAAISATRGVPQVFAFQSPSATNEFAPTKFVAIDEAVVHKVQLLSHFQSQSERSYLEPEMVTSVARYWARNLAPRAKYAEPFEVIRTLTPQPGTPPRRAPVNSTTSTRPAAPVVDLYEQAVEA